jgi:hypothetical protein
MNDEEMLTRGLRSLAAEMESLEAPEGSGSKGARSVSCAVGRLCRCHAGSRMLATG